MIDHLEDDENTKTNIELLKNIEKEITNTLIEYHKPALPIFFIIDSSGGMRSKIKIAMINQVMVEIISLFNEKLFNDYDVQIAVITYSDQPTWHSPLASTNKITWNDIVVSEGSNLGAAYDELNKKMSKTEFFNSSCCYKKPIIIQFMDLTPSDDYESALVNFKKNKWFKCSTRIAYNYGDDDLSEHLIKFTEYKERIIIKSSAVIIYRSLMEIINDILDWEQRFFGIEIDNSIDYENERNAILNKKIEDIMKKIKDDVIRPPKKDDDWDEVW